MTHLIIKQDNGIIEQVSPSVIEKLYEIVHSGNLDSSSNLMGSLNTTGTYLNYVDYLEELFTKNGVRLLIITANKLYIMFADPKVLEVLANRFGDGIGVTLLNMSGITELPDRMFEDNYTITQFNELGQFTNITSLGFNCFALSNNLVSIDLSNIERCSAGALAGTGLLIINLPKATYVEGNFGKNNILREVHIGSLVQDSHKITSLPNNFLRDRGDSLQIVTGLKMVTSVGSGAFYGDKDVLIDITSALTTVGEYAFFGCTNTIFPSLDNLTGIGSGAFRGCHNIPLSINLLNIGNTIESSVFRDCTSLQTVTLSSAITSINSNAFQDCSSLTSIDLSNVTSIGSEAFKNCTSLGTNLILELNLQNQNSSMDNAFYGTKYKGLILHIPLSVGGRYNYPAWEQMNSLEYLDLSDARFTFGTFAPYVSSLAPLKTIILGETFSEINHRSICENKPLLQYLILLSPNVVGFLEVFWSERIFHSTWAPNLHIYVLNSTLVSEYLADSVWSNVENLSTHIHPLSDLPAGVWTTGLASLYLTPAQLATS